MKSSTFFLEPRRRLLRAGLTALFFVAVLGQAAAAAAAPGAGPDRPAFGRGAAPGVDPRISSPSYSVRGGGGWPDYNSLPPEEKQRLQRQYREWQSLPPEKKEEMRRRMDEYQRKPPPQQDLYRQRYDQWRNLSPQERRRLEENLRRWDELSPQEQESLRRRFRD